MILRIAGPFFVLSLIFTIGCAAGPPLQPVSEGPPQSGESTARDAGETAKEKRAREESVLYATSRPEEDEEPVEIEEEKVGDEEKDVGRDEIDEGELDGEKEDEIEGSEEPADKQDAIFEEEQKEEDSNDESGLEEEP